MKHAWKIVALLLGAMTGFSILSAYAVDTTEWSCGNITELQTRLSALQFACAGNAKAAKKVCRAGSGIGENVAATLKDCVKGGMEEGTCSRIVSCENGIKYCTAGGYRADTSVEAIALCVKGSVGAGAEICSQTVNCQ